MFADVTLNCFLATNSESIAEVIAQLLLKYVPKDKLKKEAKRCLGALEDMDWDCQDEVELFDYLQKLEMMKDKNDYEDYEIEGFEENIKKYKKKFGF